MPIERCGRRDLGGNVPIFVAGGILSAERRGCAFLDAASVASPSPVDGLHMEPEEHAKLAAALAEKVRELLG